MITAKQIRAARALLGWSQQDLADAVNLSKPTIVDAEKTGHQSRPETLGQITGVFEDRGLEFMVGGVRERDDLFSIIEGEDCALKLLDKAHNLLRDKRGEEILYYGASQERSSNEIIKKSIEIKEAGLTSRFLIKSNDTNIMEDIIQYRWMPDKLWLDSDAKTIFGDIVAYVITWQVNPKILILKDKRLADAERKIFNFVWDISAKPTHSSSKIRY